jgi:alkanesulfonate monooxygenase SsuD/methylene tetrahydromethanopterin reductase-like flavin-dependent oxidoreductase (luciferase family)
VHPVRTARPVSRLGCWLTGGPATDGRSPALDRIGALAEAAEQAGFDSLWVTDQQLPARDDVAGSGLDGLEAYSLLGALATLTRTMRLGVLPLGPDPRHPSVVAKMVTTVDVISDGRAILTYGMASMEQPDTDRVIESLRVGRAMLEEEVPTVAGSMYAIDRAFNRPRPVQAGGVPRTLVGPEGGSGVGLAAVARAGAVDAVIVRAGREDSDGAGDLNAVVADLDDVPCQVIASIGAASDPHSRFGTEPGLDTAQVVDRVRVAVATGADGCLVPFALNTRPADLDRVATAALAALDEP